ncbi:MAG: branched-chain amino acid ABC transporter ATP-binding protein/permease [Actinomycetes bacterium]|jgi:branched-chain amino acid transport system permease protein|nr:branched-chain amino acid ABC transporter ATP-binding protein/permease [Candidatus Nanopelagicales bacterium]
MTFTRRQRTLISIVGWAIVIAIIVLFGSTLPSATQLLITSSLVLLTGVLALQIFSGNSGILSFGHVGFVGIAAYATGITVMPTEIKQTSLPDLPWGLATIELPVWQGMIVGVLFATFVGLISGLVIARLGDAASIATLAVLIVLHGSMVGAEQFTRGSQTFYGVPRFTSLTVAGIVAVLAIIVARIFRDSRIGMHLRASRDDDLAASSSGVRVQYARLVSWVLSSAVAGAMGAAYAGLLGAFSPKDFYFTMTLTLLTMLIVGGAGSVAGGVLGALIVTFIVEVLRRVGDANEFFGLTNAGLALIILLTLYFRPRGLLGFREPEESLAYRRALKVPTSLGANLPGRNTQPGEVIFAAEGIVKRFSGLIALKGVTLTVAAREVTGLIGPNGSGKSTFVNCVTGLTKPEEASIVLAGRNISSEPTWRRARLGLGRTFQTVRLFREMTVIDNVTVACISAGMTPTMADEQAIRVLEVLGVSVHGNRLPGELAYGDQRRVEIARALALNPRVMLLDEPAAGMNPVESRALLAQLDSVLTASGVGILLIDHDVALIRSACDQLTVLDYGAVLAQGVPQDVLSQPEVATAYLGWREPHALDSESIDTTDVPEGNKNEYK